MLCLGITAVFSLSYVLTRNWNKYKWWDTEINYSTDDACSNTYSASKSLLPVLLPDKAVVAPSSKPAEENDII